MLVNGDIALMSGINVAKSQSMETYKLRGAMRIAPEVVDIGNRTVPVIGVCIKYRGAMMPIVPMNQYRVGY